MEGNKRIDQLDGGIFKRGYYGVMRNQDNSETEKFTSDTLIKSEIGNYEWSSAVAEGPGYALDALVYRAELIYKSLSAVNRAIPGNDPSKWSLQARGNTGGKYTEGVYIEDDVWVLYQIEGEFHIVQLTEDALRPFLSSDFWAEYAAGKWISLTQNITQKNGEVGSGFINFDMGFMKKRDFNVGGISIDNPKTWELVNDDFGLAIDHLHFTMGPSLSAQTFPDDWLVGEATNAEWDNGTKQWIPLAEGNYTAELAKDYSLNIWKVIVHGPF